MRIGCWLICAFLLPVMSSAQPAPKPLQVGIGLMGASYIGDLTEESIYLRRIYPGGNIAIQFDGKAFLQPQFNVGFGKFAEQSDFLLPEATPEATPNRFVETSFFYTDLRMRGRFFRRRAIQPVLGAGVGLVFFNPKDAEGNSLGENIFPRLPDETYNTTVPSFSGSAGLVGRINDLLSISLEYTFRYTGTDYLDNIGMLGSRNGNDRLQHLTVGLFFTLRPRIPAKEDVPAPEDTPPVITAAEPVLPANVDPPVKKEIHGLNVDPAPGPGQPNLPRIQAQQVGKDWLAIEQAALLQKKYVYYPVRAGDDLDFLVAYFHVRRQTIHRLNYLVSEEIEPGMILRLPDMGVAFP